MECYNPRYNPRYIAYCAAHGESDPEKMLARDKETYPGGCMLGFMEWMKAQWAAWQADQEAEFPQLRGGNAHEWELYRLTHAKLFDAWLQNHNRNLTPRRIEP